jgi:hypothetical protein
MKRSIFGIQATVAALLFHAAASGQVCVPPSGQYQCGSYCAYGYDGGSCFWCEEYDDDNEDPCYYVTNGCVGSINPDDGFEIAGDVCAS